jgi:predicted Zn-dependent protease
MKAAVFVLAAMFVVGGAAPAQAQLGGLGKIKKLGDKAVDTKEKVDAMTFTDEEEKQLGELVSGKLRDRFGVVQSEPVTKYVTLVGKVIAASSKRPNLDWQFIVLDTDGVNAFAAPGGFIHITRGLLGMMKNEAQLAGVLGHEITHVSEQHTINAIKRNKRAEFAADTAGGAGGLKTALIAKVGEMVFNDVFDGKFSQGDEAESDKLGAQMANKAGYAPGGMAEVLKLIAERNAGRQDRNGFFSSHPDTKDRIEKIEKQIKTEKLTAAALVPGRYAEFIKFEAKPITDIAMNVDGAAGLASGGKKKDEKAEEPKKEEAKKGRTFGISSITASKQNQSGQQVASAGARGGVPDRDALGGPNKSKLGVKITAAELEAFKKGIAS